MSKSDTIEVSSNGVIMLKLFVILSLSFQFLFADEVVEPDYGAENYTHEWYMRMSSRPDPMTARTDDRINDEINKMSEFADKHGKKQYAYININDSATGGMVTYLVDLKNKKIKDKFPSLIGYRGMGCGHGQTPPGVLLLSDIKETGKSRKKHWGNDWAMYAMTPVEPVSRRGSGPGLTTCPHDTQVVAHSNKNIEGKKAGQRVMSKSAGCFTVPPTKLTELDDYAKAGAYVYNVP